MVTQERQAPTETIMLTLTQDDKRKLKVAAAVRGIPMTELLRQYIRRLPGVRLEGDDALEA